jgi:hypothetical protein
MRIWKILDANRLSFPSRTLALTIGVATLALGSQPRQEIAKVQVKNEVRESHFMHMGV